VREDEKKIVPGPRASRVPTYICIKYYKNTCLYVYIYTSREYYYNIITQPNTAAAVAATDYLRVDRKNPLNAKQKLIGYYKKKKYIKMYTTHSGLLKLVLDTGINYFGTIYYNILYMYYTK